MHSKFRHHAGPQDTGFAKVAIGHVGTTAPRMARLKVLNFEAIGLETVVARRVTTSHIRRDAAHDAQALLMQDLELAARRACPGRGGLFRLPARRPELAPAPDASRTENAVRTTYNLDPFPGASHRPLDPKVSRLGCAEQFASRNPGFVR